MYRAVKLGDWYIMNLRDVGNFRLSENEEEVVNIDTLVAEGTLVMLADNKEELVKIIMALGDMYQIVEAD